MAIFALRYDFRLPSGDAAARTTLFRTAIQQTAHAEAHGFTSVAVSEHHGVDDGYLPSPLLAASALAAATTNIRLLVTALLAPLYDPLRLAEDLAVLDHLSAGRVTVVLGLGYRRAEYDMLGVDWHERGRRMERCLEVLTSAWTGRSFVYEGRQVLVTPQARSPIQSVVMVGGGTPAAARRAARHGLGFFPQAADPMLRTVYEEESAARGSSGLVIEPPSGTSTYVCSQDPDRFWAEHGHHLLHEARSYASWQTGLSSAVLDTSQNVEQMREQGVYRVVTPDELVEIAQRGGPAEPITLHPLIGGLPPETGWKSLRLVAERVIPAV